MEKKINTTNDNSWIINSNNINKSNKNIKKSKNKINRWSQDNVNNATRKINQEIFAVQFKDRIVQHFYMNELGDILNAKLVKGCSSCIKNRGTAYYRVTG